MFLRLLALSSHYRAQADLFTGSRRAWRIARADALLARALSL